jgi:hypothetical protein
VKIRTGFVSNSSSCSFLVALKRMPESVSELEEIMFKDDEVYVKEFLGGSKSTKEIAASFIKVIREKPVVHGCKEFKTLRYFNEEQIKEAKEFFKQNRGAWIIWYDVPDSTDFKAYDTSFKNMKHVPFWH